MDSRLREALMARADALSGIDATASAAMTGVDFADLADARNYARMLDEYGFQENQSVNDRALQAAYANWQGQNDVNTANVGIQNDWTQAQYDALLNLIPYLTQAGLASQIGAA